MTDDELWAVSGCEWRVWVSGCGGEWVSECSQGQARQK